jgi:UDP-2-acetamido-3-amino-2,3-dideoxy-glucuronate N-acetyltransferase
VSYFIHDSATVDTDVVIGEGSSIWHFVHLRSNCQIGNDCVIGRGSFIDEDVKIGDRVKVQNYSLLYSPSILEDDVFIGPAVVLTNDKYPRATNPDGSRKTPDDWEKVGVVIRRGASVGARAVCVAPVEIGEYATVGAGAVVIHHVPAHALVVGNPARQIGWVDCNGFPLTQISSTEFLSEKSNSSYKLIDGRMTQC